MNIFLHVIDLCIRRGKKKDRTKEKETCIHPCSSHFIKYQIIRYTRNNNISDIHFILYIFRPHGPITILHLYTTSIEGCSPIIQTTYPNISLVEQGLHVVSTLWVCFTNYETLPFMFAAKIDANCMIY